MTTTMQAAQISKPSGEWELVERVLPEPRAGQVRVKVEACGICHSDVFVKEGLWPGLEYPQVPGHEIAGHIDAVGDNVRLCPSSVRVYIRGLPGDRHQTKKAWTRGPSWPSSRPLPPGDTRDACRADARHHLRPPHRPASHHPACLHPYWLGPRRHAEQQHLAQRPHVIGQPSRHRWRLGPPLPRGARSIGEFGLWESLA